MPISSEACAGPCNGRARSAWTAYDQANDQHAADMQEWLNLPGDSRGPRPLAPEPPADPVAIGAPVWCGRCPKLIESALRQANDTASVLSAEIDGYRGSAISGPNGTKPLDHKEIVNKLDELYGFLVEVEDQWREARRHPARPHRARGSHARNTCVAYLLGELGDILLHPGSVGFGLLVLHWQWRLLKLSKSDPATRRSPICCPRCRERQVRRRDDDYYECDCCGRLLNQSEHDREYAEQADQHDHDQQEVAAS